MIGEVSVTCIRLPDEWHFRLMLATVQIEKWPSNHTNQRQSDRLSFALIHSRALPLSRTHHRVVHISFAILFLIQRCNSLILENITFYISSLVTRTASRVWHADTRVLPPTWAYQLFQPPKWFDITSTDQQNHIEVEYLRYKEQEISWYMPLYGISFSHGRKESLKNHKKSRARS